jgi:hypothetical protein
MLHKITFSFSGFVGNMKKLIFAALFALTSLAAFAGNNVLTCGSIEHGPDFFLTDDGHFEVVRIAYASGETEDYILDSSDFDDIRRGKSHTFVAKKRYLSERHQDDISHAMLVRVYKYKRDPGFKATFAYKGNVSERYCTK